LVKNRLTGKLGIHAWHGTTSSRPSPFCNSS
jgi:hypothetical protein